MGGASTKIIKYKAALKRLSKDDIRMFRAGYERWAGSKKKLAKPAFQSEILTVFPGMPLELSERLYAAFDAKNTGFISVEEFICALCILTQGRRLEKLRFIFAVLDDDRTGLVDIDTIIKMTNTLDHMRPKDERGSSWHLLRNCVHAKEHGCDQITVEDFTKWIMETESEPSLVSSIYRFGEALVAGAGKVRGSGHSGLGWWGSGGGRGAGKVLGCLDVVAPSCTVPTCFVWSVNGCDDRGCVSNEVCLAWGFVALAITAVPSSHANIAAVVVQYRQGRGSTLNAYHFYTIHTSSLVPTPLSLEHTQHTHTHTPRTDIHANVLPLSRSLPSVAPPYLSSWCALLIRSACPSSHAPPCAPLSPAPPHP